MPVIQEGLAKVDARAGVFYNPRMEINRDIVSAAVGAAGAKTYCDGHSASGIKAIRVCLENPQIERVDAVDLSKRACSIIQSNVALNGCSKITVLNDDLRRVLLSHNYDFVEIDPFGTPVPFLDALSTSLSWRKQGYISITATDTAVLCGAEVRACRRNYGSVPLHDECVHEGGLRILIKKVQESFAPNGIAVEPLLSLSHRHYLKIIARCVRSAAKCDASLRQIAYLHYCPQCKHREYAHAGKNAVCSACGSAMRVHGPYWAGRLHNDEFLNALGEEIARRGYRSADEELALLDVVRGENFTGHCYDLHKLFRGTNPPKTGQIVKQLRSGGFKAAETQYKGWIIRTDATVADICGLFAK
ncbi:MAG: hypothetical protein QXU54_03125 [Candidatus Micrarchaeia archaeon]